MNTVTPLPLFSLHELHELYKLYELVCNTILIFP